jgi:hypothetical protein
MSSSCSICIIFLDLIELILFGEVKFTKLIMALFYPASYYAIPLLLLLVGPRRLTLLECTAVFRLIVLTLLWKFPLAPPVVPKSTTTRETSNRKRGTVGER